MILAALRRIIITSALLNDGKDGSSNAKTQQWQNQISLSVSVKAKTIVLTSC